MWVLIFYFGWGVYGPDSFAVVGRYNSYAVCQDMGHRVALATDRKERFYCVEELK